MKTLNILMMAAVLLPTSAVLQETTKLPSREEVLKAVDVFAKSPLSAQGKAAAAAIVTFAEKSDDVTVIVTLDFAPWLGSDKPPKIQRDAPGGLYCRERQIAA